MTVSHLLDTSVLSQPIKDRPSEIVLARWSDLGELAVCTSAVCLAEVLQGLEQRQSQKYWRRYRELLENRYAALAFDEAVAAEFGAMAAALRQLGRSRPAIDLMIAATAKRHGLTIATLNVRHFTDIPGVSVEDWNT
ncbi:MAG: type II toxin-antitoxin system VapC family toxin [Verrucomicrobia bacterium]|nr:type II toxin-antitoxin system VapC family toxin [Verrucomicrobiota bacterium]